MTIGRFVRDVIHPWRRSAANHGYSEHVATAVAIFGFAVVLAIAVACVVLGTVLLGGVYEDEYPWSWRLPAAVAAFAFGVGAAVLVVRGPQAVDFSGTEQAYVYAAGYLGALLPLIGFMVAEEPGALWALVLWLALFTIALVGTGVRRVEARQRPLDHSALSDPWSPRKPVLSLVAIVGLGLVIIGFAGWQLAQGALLNALVIASFAVLNIGIGVFAYFRSQR
jgi:hypothetical protein